MWPIRVRRRYVSGASTMGTRPWKIMRNENDVPIASKLQNYTKVATVSGGSTQRRCGSSSRTTGNNPANQTANEQWELIPLRHDKFSGSYRACSINEVQAHAWAPHNGTLTANFMMETITLCKHKRIFTYTDAEILSNFYHGGYPTVDAASTAKKNVPGFGGASEVSAYFVITNLPDPVVDIENDKGESG